MKKSLIYLLVFVGLLTSCDWIDPEINVDPDAPKDPSLYLILPSLQGFTAYNTHTFDVAGTTAMWTQQVAGSARQAASIYAYEFKEGDVANAWNGFYADALKDASIIVAKAAEISNPHYEAVGKILMAYNLGLATSLWGDIPYSEAFKGQENLDPAYDSQESIYQAVFALLDDAIAKLELPYGKFLFTLEQGDLIYGGDPDLWITAAHVLKARFYLHTAERNTGAYQSALDELDIAEFLSSDDDLDFPTGDDYGMLSPLVEYDIMRMDWENDPFFQDLLASNHGTDPRSEVLYLDPNGEAGFIWNILYNGDVPLITYVEQEFIKAEAYNKTLDDVSARASLVSAVEASMAELYADDATWLADFETDVDALSGNALYEEIMLQKYIAMFCQPEAFSDWKRSGIPVLTPTAGTTIPRRFPYSSEERSYNKSIPSLVSIFERNWTDVN
jgi:hypothetical protein